jgi:hypothetical protein
MATAHAKNRPPSAAKRWLPCPFSATVAPMYPNDETDASLKGDRWHDGMETRLVFGTLPKDCDPNMAEAMDDLADKLDKLFKAYPGGKLYVEVQLDIPQTGEFGTADILYVHPQIIIVVDEKSGYVPVKVQYNEQMLTYLLGAIALHGPRPQYILGIHQPNFEHIDGPFRTWEPTQADVSEFEQRLLYSVANPDLIAAGPHCKESYCQHRGACEAFRVYCQDDLSLGWFPSEVRGMSDADLSAALDAADQLAGQRDQLRMEAMRRILNMDRRIDGYKVVKGRKQREVRHPQAVVFAVKEQLGLEWALRLFPSLQWAEEALAPAIGQNAVLDEDVLKCLGTAKHIEDVIKQYARQFNLPRGGWKKVYDNVVGQYIVENANGLTLERAIDGRPAHKRGSEFGVLDPAKMNTLPQLL